MSLNNLLNLSRVLSKNVLKGCQYGASCNKNIILISSAVRLYSSDNKAVPKDVGTATVSVTAPAASATAPKLLSQLFPQTTVETHNTEEIEKKQKELERESFEKNKEKEKQWKRMKLGFALFGVSLSMMGGILVNEMGSPRLDDEGNPIEDEFTQMPVIPQYLKRMWKEMTFYGQMIKEPSREKLLPDPAPYPYQQPYTLVLEFTNVLVQPDWSYRTGWRFKKRPGVDLFLETMAQTAYEVVIFTTENPLMIWPILEQLDPNANRITYKLFRDSTHFVDGVHVKNLDNLNRDLSKVIVVDWNPNSTKYHPQNTLRIPKWRGNDDDTTLLDLVTLLKTIASSNVSDVREVLTYYSQFDDPIAAFRENQKKLMEQEAREKEARATQQQPMTSKWTRTFLRK